MSFKTGLYSFLTGKAGITGVVGSRIYDTIAPQDATKPFIIFSIVTSEKSNYLSGQAEDAFIILELVVVADTGKTCETITEALRNELSGFTGSMGSINVTSCFFESDSDEYVRPVDGQDFGIFSRVVQYNIWFTESLPTL